jgi:hypothetical protein
LPFATKQEATGESGKSEEFSLGTKMRPSRVVWRLKKFNGFTVKVMGGLMCSWLLRGEKVSIG